MNLYTYLLLKWKVLKPYTDLTFEVINEDVLTVLYYQAISVCKDIKNSVIILIK